MNNGVTKKELEEVLDKKLGEYQASILEAVNYGFKEARQERSELREAIAQLANTLDAFLKQLGDLQQEFAILKAQMEQVKTALKDKLGVDIGVLK